MFEIELFICIKVDLELNNLQKFICHKSKQTNKLNWIVWNWTDLDIETVIMLNWIDWNRTAYLYKNLALTTYNVYCP